jgi:hypothetical protein
MVGGRAAASPPPTRPRPRPTTSRRAGLRLPSPRQKSVAAYFTEGPSANPQEPASKRRKAATRIGECAAFRNRIRRDTNEHASLINEAVSVNKVPPQASIPTMPSGISNRWGSCRTRMPRKSLWTLWPACGPWAGPWAPCSTSVWSGSLRPRRPLAPLWSKHAREDH